MRVEEGSKRVEGRRGGLSFHTHLTVTYLNPSGNRFNVNNNKPTDDFEYNSQIGQSRVSLFTNCCLFTR